MNRDYAEYRFYFCFAEILGTAVDGWQWPVLFRDICLNVCGGTVREREIGNTKIKMATDRQAGGD